MYDKKTEWTSICGHRENELIAKSASTSAGLEIFKMQVSAGKSRDESADFWGEKKKSEPLLCCGRESILCPELYSLHVRLPLVRWALQAQDRPNRLERCRAARWRGGFSAVLIRDSRDVFYLSQRTRMNSFCWCKTIKAAKALLILK